MYVGRPNPRMRSGRRPLSGPQLVHRNQRTPPSKLVLVANRLAFGPNVQLVQDWQNAGGNDDQRFTNWTEEQLAPGGIDDSVFEAKKAAAGFSTIDKTLGTLWGDHVRGGFNRYDPADEIEMLTWMRAVHSRKQLLEVLVHHWHDHFNIHGWDYWSAPVLPDYDRMLRTHVFGNFRVMLQQVARHPAMLYYLDLYTSSRSGPNENYARELVELHTVGAEHYFGVQPQNAVPLDAQNRPLGYVDEDIFEATFAFTGWSVNYDTGFFEFVSEWHDLGQKQVLGRLIPSGGGAQDGNIVLDTVASHPGTAVHVCRRLCRRLIADEPSEATVQEAAAVFHQHWDPNVAGNENQLRRVYRTIINSDEFKNTWGLKTKRPFEMVAGALRGASVDLAFQDGADDLSSFLWRFDATGHGLFSWRSPDGFPDRRDKWESSTPRVMSWRLINWLAGIHKPNGGPPRMNVAAQTPPSENTAAEMVDYWVNRALRRTISSEDRDSLIDFLGLGNPNLVVNLGDTEDNERLRSVITVILNSPYAIER